MIVAAVPQELRDFHPDPIGGVHCLVTGMGARAGEVVRRRLRAGDVGCVVSADFSGGVRPGFEVGDLVMASEVVHVSSGERQRPDPAFFGLGRLVSVGPFVTVDRVVADPRAKSEIGARFGAVAADMETARVAKVSEQAGIPWTSIRAILDPMEFPLRIGSPAQVAYSPAEDSPVRTKSPSAASPISLLSKFGTGKATLPVHVSSAFGG